MAAPVPVILFTYARPGHLARTLECLRENHVPVIYAFSDGAATAEKAEAVAEVRRMLKAVDWCEVILCAREMNLGLGKSILAGVTEVLGKHDSAIVFEDDLICVPGTYQYMSAALEAYKDDEKVMSVTGWTHPLVTPAEVSDLPYFDGRAECWTWGTWARAWRGMDADAKTLMERCRAEGIDVYKYGADLVEMAEIELTRNIWAVRFLYLHILNGGLCLRPPWSMVEHIGFDANATNASAEIWLKNPPLKASPEIPAGWPAAIENPQCASLHRTAGVEAPVRMNRLSKISRRVVSKVRWIMGRDRGGIAEVADGLSGDFSTWAQASAASSGYDATVILEKTRDAMLKVVNGERAYERDSVLFDEVQYAWPLLSGLLWVAGKSGGRLDVLDIGGSLGSTYFQNSRFLESIPEVRWNIVEQPQHVAAGRQYFENGQLHFYDSVDACQEETSPNVVLLSSVLQYLEKPYDLLNEIGRLPLDYAIIDRTAFWSGSSDRLCVQTVPPTIYSASYPIRVFSKPNFFQKLENTWTVVAEFESLDAMPNPVNAVWRGVILERRKQN